MKFPNGKFYIFIISYDVLTKLLFQWWWSCLFSIEGKVFFKKMIGDSIESIYINIYITSRTRRCTRFTNKLQTFLRHHWYHADQMFLQIQISFQTSLRFHKSFHFSSSNFFFDFWSFICSKKHFHLIYIIFKPQYIFVTLFQMFFSFLFRITFD